MALNPLELLKLKERLKLFEQQHSRFPLFLRDVGEHALISGSVLEMKVTDPYGKEYITNIRLTPEDIETIEMMKQFREGSK